MDLTDNLEIDIRNFFGPREPKGSDNGKKTVAPKRTKGTSASDPSQDSPAPQIKASKYFGKDEAKRPAKRKKARAIVDSDDEDEVEVPQAVASPSVGKKATVDDSVRSPAKKPKADAVQAMETEPADFFNDNKKITRRGRSQKPNSFDSPASSRIPKDSSDDAPVPTKQAQNKASGRANVKKTEPTRTPMKRPATVDDEDTEVDEEIEQPSRKKRTVSKPMRETEGSKTLKKALDDGEAEITTKLQKKSVEVPLSRLDKLASKSESSSKPVPPVKVEAKGESKNEGDGETNRKLNYAQYKQRQSAGPKATGSKEIPEGEENCLAGMAFVFTGDLSSISRDDATNLIKRHGGRVTGAPSSKTSFVVVGEEPGESKLRKAKELGLKTLDEDALFELIRSSPGKAEDAGTPKAKGKGKGKSASVNPKKTVPLSINSTATGELWTVKYKPREYKDVIGNKTLIDKLASWLKKWEGYRAKGFKRQAGDESSNFRAALLSGPPGIGKTTAAHLVAEMEGYDALEFNASDTRNKKALDAIFRECTGSHAVTEYFKTGSEPPTKTLSRKPVLIMDEVDGMSGGDRGGSTELIQLIKKTKVPIICICNDRQSPKIKTLANYCLDLRFRRPAANQVEGRIRSIAASEGLELKPNVIAELVASTSADIRQILNMLSTYRLSNTVMTYDQSKDMAKAWEKHSTMSPFDVVAKLFNASSYNAATVSDKIELYFQDYGLIPLMVQENYVKVEPTIAKHLGGANQKRVQLETLTCLANAADSISCGDLVENVQRGTQNWSLMPVHAAISTVRPCFFMHGYNSGGQYGFAGWLGQNSKFTKNIRLLREIQMHMRLRISGNKSEVRLNYIPALAPALVKPLVQEGTEAVNDVINLMDEYYLTREDWDTVMELGLGPISQSKLANKIPTAVKSSFTRTYNQGSHPTPLTTISISKSKKATPAGPAPDLEEVVDVDPLEELDDENDDSEEDISADRMIKQKTTGKRGAASASESSKGKGTGRARKK